MIGTTEIVIIVGVVLVLFGAAAIPKFARSLGRAKKEFEQGIKEGQIDDEDKKKKEIEEEKKEHS
ncbi:MAG: twin-arginine translocase TatA/TatE family subunit [Spirochaetales bacterium]|jgi:sec-independent protein translocase protein TatA|nr:twin-arginine translocase TatA/TatE family subunit [Spirochaetales bacterium]